jgi:hypothetical protein
VAKKKRSTKQRTISAASPNTSPQPRPNARTLPQWRWRTFPVFFAFVAGLLIASIVNPPSSGLGYVLQFAALGGFGYALAHLFVTNVIMAGRLKRRRQSPARRDAR